MRQHIWSLTGRSVPVIGQGTWMTEESGRVRSIKALRAGIDLGALTAFRFAN